MQNSQALATKLFNLEKDFIRIQTKLDLAKDEQHSLTEQNNILAKKLANLKGAEILARLCLSEVAKLSQRLEELETLAITSVLGPNHKFVFEEFKDSLGNPKGLIPFIENPQGIKLPISKYGAGVTSIVDLAIRISIPILSGETAKLFVIDEPCPVLHQNIWPKLIPVLEQICSATGLQLIVVTHFNEQLGRIVQLTKENGVTKIANIIDKGLDV